MFVIQNKSIFTFDLCGLHGPHHTGCIWCFYLVCIPRAHSKMEICPNDSLVQTPRSPLAGEEKWTRETLDGISPTETEKKTWRCCGITSVLCSSVCLHAHLDSVLWAVEEADATDAIEDGVCTVLQHVVGADGRLTLPLGGEDGTLHHGEIFFI